MFAANRQGDAQLMKEALWLIEFVMEKRPDLPVRTSTAMEFMGRMSAFDPKRTSPVAPYGMAQVPRFARPIRLRLKPTYIGLA
jgi:hypothetical protein